MVTESGREHGTDPAVRAQQWAEDDVRVDRKGRVSVRPAVRVPLLLGLAVGALAAVVAAATGGRLVLAVVLGLAIVITAVSLVAGLVVWLVGYAGGPREPFAAPTTTRRVGVAILNLVPAGLGVAAAALLLDPVVTGLGLYR